MSFMFFSRLSFFVAGGLVQGLPGFEESAARDSGMTEAVGAVSS